MDSVGQKMTIGGIQTYISHLTILANRLGYQVRIFQFADKPFCIEQSPNITIFGIKIAGRKRTDKLIDYALSHRDFCKNQYLTIFANVDNMMPSFRVPHSICIQHGVGWDRLSKGKIPLWLRLLSRTYFSYRIIRNMQRVDEVVCVDNNFINWYRTLDSYRSIHLTPIMNFTPIVSFKKHKKSNLTSIVFARRFFDYRGTRIFAAAAKRLLQEFSTIQIIFAGEGPDERYLKDTFLGIPNVSFTQYNSENSIEFHQMYDIAVVPTTGSEGTSLSLLEAMAAGCTVVCTNVGGMTNIILDRYNGLMVNPEIDELYEALVCVITDLSLRKKLALNGYKTVCNAFSLKQWECKWASVLDKHFKLFDAKSHES